MTGMKGIIIGCICFLAGDGNAPINPLMLMVLEMIYGFVINKKVA